MAENTITINDEIEYTVSDKTLAPIMSILERYSFEAMDGGRESGKTMFVSLVALLAKLHYGPGFDLETCTIWVTGDKRKVGTVTFSQRSGARSQSIEELDSEWNTKEC